MKKIIIIIITTMAIIFIGLVIYQVSNKPVTTGINIAVVPSDSQLFIDNKQVSSGVNGLTPGKHTVKASHTNFTTQETPVFVTEGIIAFQPIGLSPSNSAGETWKNANSNAYIELSGLGGNEYDKQGESLVQAYPIIKNLPLDISPEYRIDYGVSKKFPNDPSKIALYISANSSTTRHAALQAIYLFGYDPSDYEIIFQPLETNN